MLSPNYEIWMEDVGDLHPLAEAFIASTAALGRAAVGQGPPVGINTPDPNDYLGWVEIVEPETLTVVQNVRNLDTSTVGPRTIPTSIWIGKLADADVDNPYAPATRQSGASCFLDCQTTLLGGMAGRLGDRFAEWMYRSYSTQRIIRLYEDVTEFRNGRWQEPPRPNASR